MPRALGLLVATAPLLCVACPLFNPPDPGPDPVEDCYTEQPGGIDTLPSRSVELGVMGANGVFHAYEDGEMLELVGGFQGAEMITPTIELPAQDSDGDSPCWWVQIEYIGEDSQSFGNRGGLVFERVGEVLRAGPLFEQPYEFFGATVTMRVTVVGDDFAAIDEVEVMIPDY